MIRRYPDPMDCNLVCEKLLEGLKREPRLNTPGRDPIIVDMLEKRYNHIIYITDFSMYT